MPKGLAFLCVLPLVFGTSAFAQNVSDFLNLFRGVIVQGMIQAAQSEWRRLPSTELSCLDQTLRQHGASVEALISRGVLPSDRRLDQLRSNCRGQIALGPHSATAQPSPYIVDGLALGGQVRFESEAYKEYQCTPSEKFPGFTWCHKEKTEKTKHGEVTLANSILHNEEGIAVYVNRYVEPALFGPNDVPEEIGRLSARFGERAREIWMPAREGLPRAVIAVWGKIELSQLDAADVSTVASGGRHKGLLVSFLGDLQRSAKAGVPVYELAGGAGFLWAATFNQDGRGVLRFLTVDASQIGSLPAPGAASPRSAIPPAANAGPMPPTGSKPDAGVEKLSALAKTRTTRGLIEQRLASIHFPDLRAQADEVLAKLAAANLNMSLEELDNLNRSGDKIVTRLGEMDDFDRVSSIATKQIGRIRDDLKTVVTDAPYLREINDAIDELEKSQRSDILPALQDALGKLNRVYEQTQKQRDRDRFKIP
jgi:hypothetical protein